VEKFIIGCVDTDPDTGSDYSFVKICETETEQICNWLVDVLSKDLLDEPNRRIVIKKQ
jgi:hypothetical protein